MKKYLFGFAAIVLAIGFSAFTKPTKVTTFTDVKFDFNQTSFVQSAVENLANWEYDAEAATCSESTYKACSVVVAPAYYHLVSGVPTLNTAAYPSGSPEVGDLAATLSAEPGTVTSDYRLKASGTTAVSFVNRGQ